MKEGFCYVIRPNNDAQDWQLIFETIIEPAVIEAGFTECVLGAPMGTPGVPIHKIVSALVEAELLIADVTGCNDPDVFYKLGVRHARSNRTILIAQDNADIPGVFVPYHSITYKPDLQALKDFKKQLLEKVSKIKAEPESPDNPILNYLKRDVELHEELQSLRKQVADLERRLAVRLTESEPGEERITFRRVIK